MAHGWWGASYRLLCPAARPRGVDSVDRHTSLTDAKLGKQGFSAAKLLSQSFSKTSERTLAISSRNDDKWLPSQ